MAQLGQNWSQRILKAKSYAWRSYRGKAGKMGLFAPLILNKVNESWFKKETHKGLQRVYSYNKMKLNSVHIGEEGTLYLASSSFTNIVLSRIIKSW